MKKSGGTLLLLLTAFIWGTAFVAQRSGMDFIGPITFQCVRSLLGFFSLLPVVYYRKKRLGSAFRTPSLAGALACGLILAAASTLQQTGLKYTPAGKAGFISALYVVLVPLLGLFLRRRVRPLVWLSVLLALFGLYLISSVGSFSLQKGEWLILASALLYAMHILAVDHFAPDMDGVTLSCLQFLVAGLAVLPPAFLCEQPQAAQLWDARWALLYAGVLSSGVGYTLQIIGQQRTPPVIASLTLSLESVFSAIAGGLILHEIMSGRELAGCALVLLAVIVSQLPQRHAKG